MENRERSNLVKLCKKVRIRVHGMKERENQSRDDRKERKRYEGGNEKKFQNENKV